MRVFFTIVVVCFINFSFSQSKSFEISGTLISEVDKQPIESATVYLQQVKDSSLITYTVSDQQGKFLLENNGNVAEADLYVSHIGYQTYYRRIQINQSIINAGEIALMINTNELDEVVVKSSAPITIKKDTIEFNVKSFKVKKDANIEDLLKELPGFEVDADGKIKVNGKEMNKILVNGKPFFGDDPTIATRNLSKEIVEKIQVSDTKTDSESFTGEEGDRTNKTVNLVIKKENNKGIFGRLAAGVGTDKRYEFAGMFNTFNDDLQFSILGGGNNINSPGFSFGEIRKMFGGSYNINRQLFYDKGDGVSTSRNTGLNYADDLGEKVVISTNYFASNVDLDNIRISERENILPDNRFFTNSSSNTNSNAEEHSTETKLQIKVDSTLQIIVEPKFRYAMSTNTSSNAEESFDEDQLLINESISGSFTERREKFFSNNVNFTKRFGNKGSFLKLDIFNRNTKTDIEDIFNSQVDVYGEDPESITRNQLGMEEKNDDTFIAGMSYRLPIKGKELSMDLKYGYRNNVQGNLKNSFDFNEVTQEYDTDINVDLSSDFEYKNITSTPGVSLQYKKEKWSSSLGMDLIFRTLENNDFLRPSFNLSRNFNAVTVAYRLNYRSPKSSLGAGYNLRNNPPQLNQLQTFIDITNPLEIVVGNPSLKPSNNHDFHMYYNANNFQKGRDLYTYLNAQIQNNGITVKRTINENLTRETTYANVNGGYRVNMYMGYNKKIKMDTLKTIQFNFGFNPELRRVINFNGDIQYANLSKTISPSLGTRFVWKDITELGINYRISLTQSNFDIDGFDNQDFSNHLLFLRTATFVPKNVEWRNEITYTYNPDVADGFEKSAWFWNSTLAYSFMKDRATLTLKAYDLLNQNTNVRRITNEYFIEDRQSNVLQRYFMLGFSWKFNTLGKAGEVRDSGYRIIN